jgi:uncharacterized membrane protein HdeD (DUF308 family)
VEASVSTDFTQQAISANVKASKGWLKFLGILSIIAGGLYALTLVGIVVAWMPIWVGIIMVQAGSRAQEYAERGDPKALAGYTGKIKTLFAIMGILTLISLGQRERVRVRRVVRRLVPANWWQSILGRRATSDRRWCCRPNAGFPLRPR